MQQFRFDLAISLTVQINFIDSCHLETFPFCKIITPPIEKIKRSPKERQKIATARQKIAELYYKDRQKIAKRSLKDRHRTPKERQKIAEYW